MTAKLQARRDDLAEKSKKEGEAFLTANRHKPGVVALASGLQYVVITPGSGKSPGLDDRVTVHYRGTFIDGIEFDSSRHRGEPATFALSGIIPGWAEALQRMKVGAEWKVFVPSYLAYGEQGQGPIGPNATLIFEIELLGIQEGGGGAGLR